MSAGIVIVLLVFASVTTSAGHIVLTATQHFLLKYSGVFALIALTGSVCMGVIATDRIVMTPGHRVLAQAVHRAVSFGALAFLIIHIVLEIIAKQLEESTTQHVHLLDAFIPFLSQYRTFYMAEGTIASDIIVLLVITGIVRRRFTASGHAWKWRAIHYSSYAALILGVLHGLLAGRKAIGSFVYWSYGIVIALVVLAVLVRILATSLRSKDAVKSASALSDLGSPASSAQSMPARAAALGLMGQLTGAMPLGGATRSLSTFPGAAAAGPAMPLAAPYAPADQPPQVPRVIAPLPGPPQGGPASAGRMPRYEPGYDGPPRYEGAPARRPTDPAGPGQDAAYGTGPQPAYGTGPQGAYGTGPQPVHRTGQQPAYRGDARPSTGTGPQPAHGGGPQPPNRNRTGPLPASGTGPQPAYQGGARSSGRTGTQPGYEGGPRPSDRTGPLPAYGTGPQPVYPAGSPSGRGPGPRPGYPAGPPPGYGSGPRRGNGAGPEPVYPGPAPARGAGSQPGYPAARDRDYEQDPRYQPDSGYGENRGYGPDQDYGRGPGYGPDPGYGPEENYGPDPGYGAPPPRPRNGYGGPPPSGYTGSPDRPGPGRRRRPRPADTSANERTGPLPRVPSYGGDERR